MSRILILLMAALMLGAMKSNNCPKLQFEGIYAFRVDAESSAVIRFYADRVVLVSTSINDYAQVMTWFNREPENFSRVLTGKYSRDKNCSIQFKVKGETGVQVYTGNIVNDTLLNLQILNPATKAKTSREYKFVKL